MPYEWVQHTRTFVPDQAFEIAARFLSAAEHMHDLATDLRGLAATLEAAWDGRSKDHYSDAFAAQPASVDSAAEWLQAQAWNIESTTVTETWTSWEWVQESN